ncbi:hypothetical protein D9Q98_007605 [Chlorella vulgaris]|uniref:Auxin-responsive protein n=1 Tax=Chlorella vulgaris TaxID=3077 RepID=A0A9D4TLT4_CHLVU|nr:hypothetical protein D9Q98_007605 [Chlorella vulgaris]
MAHIKALRTKWLAAFAEQQTGNGPAASAAAENEPAPEHALLPKKRLLESAGTGSGQQLDSLLAKKQRQVDDGPAGKAAANGADASAGRLTQQPPQQQTKPKPGPSRLSGDRARSDATAANKPSVPAAAAAAAAAGRPGKREGAAAGSEASKPGRAKEAGKGVADKAGNKQAAGERLMKKEAAVKKELGAAAAGAAGSKREAAERPVKKEPAAGSKVGAVAAAAAADKPAAKAKGQAEANGRPAKPAAAKPAAAKPAAAKPAAAKPAAAKPAGQAAKLAAAVKQEQQQEHAGSNPSSMHRDGGLANSGEQRQQHQQVTSPARPAAHKSELAAAAAAAAGGSPGPAAAGPGAAVRGEEGSGSVGTPVEVLLGPSEPAQPVGHLVVAMYGGQAELWEAVRSSFSDKLPSGKARLVYQDADGDWLLLQPEAPWHLFTRSVRKLVVTAASAPPAPEQQLPKIEA